MIHVCESPFDSKSRRGGANLKRANKCRNIHSSTLDRSSTIFHGLPLYGEIYRALFVFSPLPPPPHSRSFPYLFPGVKRGDLREMRDPAKRSRRQKESRKASSSQYRETHSSLWNASGRRAQTEEGRKMVAI